MNLAESSLVNNAKPRACVLFPGAFGDFVCFLPALRELTNTNPVDLLARSDFAAIAPPGVHVQSLERFEVRQLFVSDGACDEQVSRFFAGYAAVYSWFASQQPVFVEQLHKVAQGRVQVFPFRREGLNLHQADYYLACLNKHEAWDGSEALVTCRSDALLWRDAFCINNGIGGEPLLIVASGSGAWQKNWPEGHFLQVVDWWRRDIGGKAVVVAGPVELERRGIERLSASGVLASGLDLAQLAALLARCDLYIGNDSGVSHLAAAVGARTVTIFGPSDERQWAPRGPRTTILRRQSGYSPSDDGAMKLVSESIGLAALSPVEVIQELRKLPEIVNLTRLGVGITV